MLTAILWCCFVCTAVRHSRWGVRCVCLFVRVVVVGDSKAYIWKDLLFEPHGFGLWVAIQSSGGVPKGMVRGPRGWIEEYWKPWQMSLLRGGAILVVRMASFLETCRAIARKVKMARWQSVRENMRNLTHAWIDIRGILAGLIRLKTMFV